MPSTRLLSLLICVLIVVPMACAAPADPERTEGGMSAEDRNIPEGIDFAVAAWLPDGMLSLVPLGSPYLTPLLLVFEDRRVIIKDDPAVHWHEDDAYVVYDLPEDAYQRLWEALDRHLALTPEERPLTACAPTVLTIVSKNGLREFHETDRRGNDSRLLVDRVRQLLEEEALPGQRQEGHGLEPSAFAYGE